MATALRFGGCARLGISDRSARIRRPGSGIRRMDRRSGKAREPGRGTGGGVSADLPILAGPAQAARRARQRTPGATRRGAKVAPALALNARSRRYAAFLYDSSDQSSTKRTDAS